MIKGIVIVKRTGVFKSFIRFIKRDYPIEYFLNQEIKKHDIILGRYYRIKICGKNNQSCSLQEQIHSAILIINVKI